MSKTHKNFENQFSFRYAKNYDFDKFCRAYWGFADHFKDHADMLLNSLDHNHRRLLQVNLGRIQFWG